mgnify:CR=1 FL=1|tara:strand:+ start:372 stop:713 length:342 start_codon:yes stop_codon:yes gene_type:complete
MIKLTYFPIAEMKPVNLVFKSFEAFRCYLYNVALTNHNNDVKPVYLLISSIDGEHEEHSFNLIDENLDLMHDIIQLNDFDVFNTWHLHEYESYESAYAVALDMKEGNALCYDN